MAFHRVTAAFFWHQFGPDFHRPKPDPHRVHLSLTTYCARL